MKWNEKTSSNHLIWVDIYILFRTIQEREILLWPFKTWFDSVLIDRFIPFSHEVEEIPALLIKQNKTKNLEKKWACLCNLIIN